MSLFDSKWTHSDGGQFCKKEWVKFCFPCKIRILNSNVAVSKFENRKD